MLCLDFDHLQNLNDLKSRLLADEYFDTQLLFVSPSGNGLKWIISISPPLEDYDSYSPLLRRGCPKDRRGNDLGGSHGDYFAAVANYILQTYGIAIDKSGRDISRACFLPHDPQAYINPSIRNS